MRRSLLVALGLLLALGIVVAFVVALERGGADDSLPDDPEVSSPAGGGPVDPVLIGTGIEAPPALERDTTYDHVTDVATLVRGSGVGNAAQARLVSLGRRRSEVIAELVAWLHPDRDKERWPPPPPGARFSGASIPGLYALQDTLERLAPASVAPLAEALSDENAGFRRRVLRCLRHIGPNAKGAVDALIARLQPGIEDVPGQVAVFQVLSAIGEGARVALPHFHAYMRDADLPDEVRAEAAAGFLAVAGPTPEALETCAVAIRDQSYEVCRALLPGLATLGEEGASLRGELLALAQDAQAHDLIRMDVIEALGGMPDKEGRLRAALIDIALDTDELDRTRAAAIRSLAAQGEAALDALLRALTAAEDETRLLVVAALTQQGESVSPERLRTLLDPLQEAEYEADRVKAVGLGAKTGGDRRALIAWLARWLEDSDAQVRRCVIWELSMMRDDTGAVVEALLEVAKDEDAELRWGAIEALMERASNAMGDETFLRQGGVADLAASLLKVEDEDHREAAATLLHYVAPERDLEALEFWLSLLEDGRWPHLACAVLSGLGPKAKDAIPVVERALEAWKDQPYMAQVLQRTLDAIRPR